MAAPLGEAHPRARLPDWKVREMRRLHHALQFGYRFLGWMYGVSWLTARDIVTYRTRIGA